MQNPAWRDSLHVSADFVFWSPGFRKTALMLPRKVDSNSVVFTTRSYSIIGKKSAALPFAYDGSHSTVRNVSTTRPALFARRRSLAGRFARYTVGHGSWLSDGKARSL